MKQINQKIPCAESNEISRLESGALIMNAVIGIIASVVFLISLFRLMNGSTNSLIAMGVSGIIIIWRSFISYLIKTFFCIVFDFHAIRTKMCNDALDTAASNEETK